MKRRIVRADFRGTKARWWWFEAWACCWCYGGCQWCELSRWESLKCALECRWGKANWRKQVAA